MHAERGFTPPMRELPNFCDRVDDELEASGRASARTSDLLFVGRLERSKGLHAWVIEAWHRAPSTTC